ncbi:MAG: hypothetical protein PVJ67_00230 [Candidatus Pacearchaeota archaeon]|jgi:hypothetical protein
MDLMGFYIFGVNKEISNPDGGITYEGTLSFRELTQKDINNSSTKDLERFLETIRVQLNGGGCFSDSNIFRNRINQSAIYRAKYFVGEKLSNQNP